MRTGATTGRNEPRRAHIRGELMASERSVGVVWSEETDNGVVLHMRVGTGADVMLTLPNAAVAAQAEAQLRSVLAMAAMQFQQVAKETTSGHVVGGLHARGDQGPHCGAGRGSREDDLGRPP